MFEMTIEHNIPRTSLLEEIMLLITPSPEKQSRPYPLIIGEHGTGKTSLIKLAVSSMNKNESEPKGVVYVDIPLECDKEVNITKAMRVAMGWDSYQLNECDYSSSLSVSID